MFYSLFGHFIDNENQIIYNKSMKKLIFTIFILIGIVFFVSIFLVTKNALKEQTIINLNKIDFLGSNYILKRSKMGINGEWINDYALNGYNLYNSQDIVTIQEFPEYVTQEEIIAFLERIIKPEVTDYNQIHISENKDIITYYRFVNNENPYIEATFMIAQTFTDKKYNIFCFLTKKYYMDNYSQNEIVSIFEKDKYKIIEGLKNITIPELIRTNIH